MVTEDKAKHIVQMRVGWQIQGWEIRVNSNCFYFAVKYKVKPWAGGWEFEERRKD